MPEIRVLDPRRDEDVRPAEGVLAEAFRDAPLNVAVIRGGPERRLRSNRYGMRALTASVQAAARSGALLLGVGDPARGADAKAALDGVLVAAPPLHFPLPPPPTGVQLRCLFGQGWRTLRRWGEVYRALLAIHPQEAHWYLSVVGVAPDRQARGCGSALVAALTERCDADGAPAYLECDDRANLAFYERSGFRVVQQTRVLDVPVWCMWRDPK